jgi:hypothetical protein
MSDIDEIKALAEADLYTFAVLVNPKYLYGDVHKKVFKWLMQVDHPNQLLLLPRGGSLRTLIQLSSTSQLRLIWQSSSYMQLRIC